MLSLGRNIRNITDDRDIPFKLNNELEKILNKYDKNFLSYIARLYEAIYGEKLDFTKLKSTVDALAKFNEKQEFNYLNNLLYPEKCIGCKIPSALPVPSCSFQLHNSIALKTNANGCLALHFNPFFLFNNTFDNQKNVYFNTNELQDQWETESIRYSSLFAANGNTLNGHQICDDWNCIDIGQMIPPVYNQYRLVSASIVVKYIGRLDIASGVIGGAIVFDETNTVGVFGKMATNDGEYTDDYKSVPSILEKYGNFDLAMDSFYYQENLCIEGMRQLYFPIDNSYEEYSKLLGPKVINLKMDNLASATNPTMYCDSDILKNGFKFMIYTLGAPPSSACFKVDIFCNFECLPNAEFLNYLPLSMNVDHITPEQKKEAQLIVQNKPIMKISESEQSKPAEKPSIWTRMLNKFRNALPGIGKLIGAGLVKAIPALKPGVALANAMIGMVTD